MYIHIHTYTLEVFSVKLLFCNLVSLLKLISYSFVVVEDGILHINNHVFYKLGCFLFLHFQSVCHLIIFLPWLHWLGILVWWWIYLIFLKVFMSMFMQGMAQYFACTVFVLFWYEGNAGLIKKKMFLSFLFYGRASL